MSFAETYREERLINRRSRARKARIAGRVIGFVLSGLLVVALRTEPQLRAVVQDLALAVIGAGGGSPQAGNASAQSAQAAGINALGYKPDSQEARALETLGISDQPAQTAPLTSQLPVSRVKINRGG